MKRKKKKTTTNIKNDKKTYLIPMCLELTGLIPIKANTLEEALQKALHDKNVEENLLLNSDITDLHYQICSGEDHSNRYCEKASKNFMRLNPPHK